MNTPSEAVVAFIRAHHAWEMAANERAKLARGSSNAEYLAALGVAKREYRELVSRFCAASVEPQGAAFGDDGFHVPERETIESTSVTGQSAIVLTKHVYLDGFVAKYEYHLVQEADEWRVASLLSVLDDGKYECL